MPDPVMIVVRARRRRVWPKLLFGVVGAFFMAHGSVLVGGVMVALAGVYLWRAA